MFRIKFKEIKEIAEEKMKGKTEPDLDAYQRIKPEDMPIEAAYAFWDALFGTPIEEEV